MLLAIGDYEIQLNEWQSAGAMNIFLEQCQLGILDLEDAQNTGIYSYTLLITSAKGRFGIMFSAPYMGLKPAILLDYARLNVIIGFAQAVKFVNLHTQQLTSTYALHYLFHGFRTLTHLGVHDFFLVEGELELAALTYGGKCVWQYQAPDIINGVSLTNQELVLQIWDDPVSVRLNLHNGKPIEN